MSTKLNNIIINPEYQNLFEFKNEEEKIEHNAQMISYRILSEIEKLCDEKSIKKKDLAELVGTSKSYITQLFNGSKSVNTFIMAKFEEVLNITFEIRLKLNEDTYEDFFCKQMNIDLFTKRRFSSTEGAWFYCPRKEKTEKLISDLETENQLKQKVA